jgi:serine/threonine protein phosphatase PrpC
VAAASRVDEDDVEACLLGVCDGVGGDVGRVFAVALFEQVDVPCA